MFPELLLHINDKILPKVHLLLLDKIVEKALTYM